MRIKALINRHIEEAVNKEWPEMAQQHETLSTLPTALIEELHDMLAMHPADNSQRSAQSEMIRAPYGSGCATPAHRYQRVFCRRS